MVITEVVFRFLLSRIAGNQSFLDNFTEEPDSNLGINVVVFLLKDQVALDRHLLYRRKDD